LNNFFFLFKFIKKKEQASNLLNKSESDCTSNIILPTNNIEAGKIDNKLNVNCNSNQKSNEPTTASTPQIKVLSINEDSKKLMVKCSEQYKKTVELESKNKLNRPIVKNKKKILQINCPNCYLNRKYKEKQTSDKQAKTEVWNFFFFFLNFFKSFLNLNLFSRFHPLI
jgi:hypothetical protein